MSQSFKVNVNSTFDFDITAAESEQLDSVKTASQQSHILKDQKSYSTEILKSNFLKKTYQVKVNNNSYHVAIANDLDQLITAMGFELGSSKVINEIKAPMPGLILDIPIKVGQEVEENDTLLILEAMKMENVLSSPRAGVIKSISVKKGDAVDKNALLLEFE
ncbi:acetyl-CoA carboxylase biotin carboxyl carrier protein subunit [Subsaximicrobium wynnwilliamsii]|uniref:Acetyl-CoA carboxylase biotin carboxyl carrier protein subunit n=1 Tax=Subsaximicrobium wynnwilliamsii TaxID=291179 RepID=A0A5C6ZJK2_9FLAO|nr:acetyl-CoA carboxylase biotin carboxyl carrier protein subunit [Subsaximicrobium wynnwilliamsii]TXD84724.1 acetyl-CoA carboxylase biotin carboxyl carrier protein subunit [Subsaximicrobium wynnwilliamsii]TXD90394.1 acetyl-CoA carboxylase biotin carboxyl carrier protein subunit [Subsaximicrobium wynnwilliamsii]TXE04870.1 acetyl-CoA carboxylase biotin carboxyl carrier protein subunit [Subsaximicrobium wynnwilliamsii]